MSGTSYDGIDVAAVDLSLDGAEIAFRPLGALEVPHAGEVRALVESVLPPAAIPMGDVCRLDTLLGQAFAVAAAEGIAQLCDGAADLVVSHGQTVFHWVENRAVKGTLQLGQPSWIAQRTGVPVVSDLRARDITVGGQGAPLVSAFDALLVPPAPEPRGLLNLGGIANITVIGREGDVLAYDTGPANALIDAACRELFDEPYDADGRHAANGSVNDALLEVLLAEPYFAREPPKTTGKELFHGRFLHDRREGVGRVGVEPDDVVATVTELTARTVAAAVRAHGLTELVVSGGGVANPTLMERIAASARGTRIRPIEEFGIPAAAKEAYAFAVLGFLTAHGLPGTVPACTGAARSSILGSITPGDGPLRLPPPATVRPTRLRVEPSRNERIGP